MKNFVCLIGVGEMGGVFARGLLRSGHPVYPVTRGMTLMEAAKEIPDPEAVVVGVRENELPGILRTMPQNWRDKLVLVQNELLPRDWQDQKIITPTVISVWFEKKRPMDYKVIIPSPVYGPRADLVEAALSSLDIPCQVLNSDEDLLFELVLKNLYILTINIAGLEVGGTVRELWGQHQSLAKDITNDVLDIQFDLIEQKLDRGRLIEGMVKAFAGDWDHKCLGRTAPARLERVVQQADAAGLAVKTLKKISAQQKVKIK